MKRLIKRIRALAWRFIKRIRTLAWRGLKAAVKHAVVLIPRGAKRLAQLILVLVPLGLIGYGAWLIYPPAGFLSVGVLIWIDLFTMRPQSMAKKKTENDPAKI